MTPSERQETLEWAWALIASTVEGRVDERQRALGIDRDVGGNYHALVFLPED